MNQIVVPMAGAGSRYSQAGYRTPKPLIEVSGLPMVVRAVKDLPPAGRVVFICRKEHMEDYGAERIISKHVAGARFVVTDGLTEGQACTVALASSELDPNKPVIVAACDNTHVYDMDRYQQLAADPTVDTIIWTFRGEPRCALHPNSYGWVRTTGPDCTDVREISCKKPISETPVNDHVISGFFSFRNAGMMLDAIAGMVEADIRVNNEFYMDIVPNTIIENGGRAVVFEVDKYIGWGTPDDLKDYKNLERYFSKL